MVLAMDTYTDAYCEAVVLHWLSDGPKTRHELRRKKARKAEWERFEVALDRLLRAEIVTAYRPEKIPGTPGRPPTIYAAAKQ